MFNFSDTPLTLILLLLNILVSLYALYQADDLIDRWSFRPQQILHQGQWFRMVSSGFLHAGIAHLAFNMITLYFFGPVLERLLGTFRFGLIYFGALLAANALTLVLQRGNAGYSAIGASGAISGVVFAFCLFYPFTQLLVFFIPMPAIVFAVLYVVLSIYGARQGQAAGNLGGIAHEAHLGGALGGLLLTILLEPGALGQFFRQLPF